MDDPEEIRREVEAAAERERLAAEAAGAGKEPEKPKGVAGTDITAEEIEEAHGLNQVGDARLLVRLLDGKYCYDNTECLPYRYNCTHWYQDENLDYKRAMFGVADLYSNRAAAYGKLYKETEDKAYQQKRDNYNKRAGQCRSLNRMNAVWSIATSGDGSLGISGDAWNTHPTLFPCANGVIDLENGKKHPGRPDQYFNQASPLEYHGLNADAELWDDILEKALCRNKDLIDFFEIFAGFAATGLQTKQFFCALGPGGDNGKSVIFETMGRALGGFAGTIPVELLLEQKFSKSADGPSPGILKLRGLRLAVTSEAQRSHRFSLAKVKQLTAGGDELEARGLYGKKAIEFNQTHSLVLHSNYMPQAVGNDSAFYNRLRVLKFGAKFIPPGDGPEDPGANIWHQIPRVKLDKGLAAIGPGILAWFVRGAIRALKLGDMPTAPDCVLKETSDYREENDLVGQWINACCEREPEAKEQMKDIHAAFARWCVEALNIHKDRVMSMKSLAADFKQRPEIEKIEGRVIHYRGLRIRNEWREGEKRQDLF